MSRIFTYLNKLFLFEQDSSEHILKIDQPRFTLGSTNGRLNHNVVREYKKFSTKHKKVSQKVLSSPASMCLQVFF